MSPEFETSYQEVMAGAMDLGAASDHLVEAIVNWLTAHPDPSPDLVAAWGRVLIDVWHSDFAPEWMGRDLWLRAFRAVGFVSDGVRSAPRRSLVVYRGAEPDEVCHMAWTTSRGVASGHVNATTQLGNEPEQLISPARRLWRAVIPPEGILACIEARNEREVVVDPSFLRSVAPVVTS